MIISVKRDLKISYKISTLSDYNTVSMTFCLVCFISKKYIGQLLHLMFCHFYIAFLMPSQISRVSTGTVWCTLNLILINTTVDTFIYLFLWKTNSWQIQQSSRPVYSCMTVDQLLSNKYCLDQADKHQNVYWLF